MCVAHLTTTSHLSYFFLLKLIDRKRIIIFKTNKKLFQALVLFKIKSCFVEEKGTLVLFSKKLKKISTALVKKNFRIHLIVSRNYTQNIEYFRRFQFFSKYRC
jgi:hypothetical protein